MRASKNMSMTWALLPLFVAAALPAQANVFISTQPTSNMSCSGGLCAPTAQPANLNTTDLAHMLASSDVTVMSGSDTNRREIVVKSMFGWASSHRLTLDANYAVEIDAPISVHGPGALTVTHHIFPGTLSFGPGGHVAFWDLSSSVVLNGTAYTLVGDLAGLASAIATNSTGHFALAGDVKPATIYSASPVPTTFNGVLEGLGNRILYLRINDTAANQYDGLFATIGPYGGVLDLGLVNAKIQASRARASEPSQAKATARSCGPMRPEWCFTPEVADISAGWLAGTRATSKVIPRRPFAASKTSPPAESPAARMSTAAGRPASARARAAM